MVMGNLLPAQELRLLFEQLSTTVDKGKALEDFCAVFFGSIPGVEVYERRVLDDARSQELDLTLWNERASAGLPDLDEILFVEAKNWKDPVGSAEVAWFDWKIRLSGYTQGFLVAMNGITGREDDKTSAWAIVSEANRQGRRLLVLTPNEMMSCLTSNQFRRLVLDKRMRTASRRAQID